MKTQIIQAVSLIVISFALQSCGKGSSSEYSGAELCPLGGVCAQEQTLQAKSLTFQKSADGTLLHYGWETTGLYSIGMARVHPGQSSCGYVTQYNSSEQWTRWMAPYAGAASVETVFVIPDSILGCRFDYCIQAIDHQPTPNEVGSIDETDPTVKCGFVEY